MSEFEPKVTTAKTRDKEDVQKFLKTARSRLEKVSKSEAKNREAALDDLKFKAGNQWPLDVQADRNAQRRPCLTVNKIPTFVNQIVNDQRQNRPSINFSPVGEKSDREVSKMLSGMVRHIQRDSSADIAFDTGFESAVTMGWGYWRIATEYESESTFNQVIRVLRIRNPFTVYLDPDRKMPDASDAKWGLISELIDRKEFERLYPDADPLPLEGSGAGEDVKAWTTGDDIRIAEYFYPHKRERVLIALENGHEGFEDELSEESKSYIASHPDAVQNKRTVQVTEIRWCKISGRDILETSDWVWYCVPIVECMGMEVDIEGKVSKAGIVRFAKDAQRQYNYWVTAETEHVALAPKAKYIMEEGQLEGHETEWRKANTTSYPVLTYKGTSVNGQPAPPPQQQMAPQIPEGIVSAKAGSAQDMMATTGIRFDSTLSERTYDESGKALIELQRRSDLGSYHYLDNYARSLRHTGNIIMQLIPQVYDTPRIQTILREDDKEEQVMIDPHANKAYAEVQKPDGKKQKVFNPNFGKYEVTVTIGPSYATRRIESLHSMIDFVRSFPNSAPLMMDLIAKNSDWPGSEEISKRLATQVPMRALMQSNPDMSPQVQGLISQMQQQMQQLMLERQAMIKAMGDKTADRQLEKDKIESDFEAKVLKIMADFESKGLGRLDNTVDELLKAMEKLDFMKGTETPGQDGQISLPVGNTGPTMG